MPRNARKAGPRRNMRIELVLRAWSLAIMLKQASKQELPLYTNLPHHKVSAITSLSNLTKVTKLTIRMCGAGFEPQPRTITILTAILWLLFSLSRETRGQCFKRVHGHLLTIPFAIHYSHRSQCVGTEQKRWCHSTTDAANGQSAVWTIC
jgi:hypothetical protein